MAFTLQTLDQLPLFLSALRKQRQLTQAALAAQLGMSQQAYAQLEANPAVTSVERLFRVMQMLQVSLNLVPVSTDVIELPPSDLAAGSRQTAPAPALAHAPRHKAPASVLDPEAQARILREVW